MLGTLTGISALEMRFLRVQVTTKGSFNSFPMLSFDGKKIAWCSNRDAAPGDYSTIDIYVADWVGGGFSDESVRPLQW
jgi:hypothetical protein